MKTRMLWTAGALVLSAGCGERNPRLERGVEVLPVAAVDDHAVFVDRRNAEARLVEVSGTQAPASPEVVDLPANPVLTAARRGEREDNELLVLCAGQPDDGTADPEDPALVVLRGDGVARAYPLKSAFNRVEQSSDGRYAFLYFDPAAPRPAGSSLLFNPNEVAVVDLDDADEGAVHPRTLRSLDGSSPRRVAFSPSMDIAGQTRRIAVVLFASDVGIFDLDHDRDDFTVELSPGKKTALSLSKVVFSETVPRVYVIGEGSDDLYALTLLAKDEGAVLEPNENDFTPFVNQVFVGGGPADLALYEEEDEERVLVVARAGQKAVIVNVASNRTTTVGLPEAESRILMFEGPTPSDPNSKTRALLYADGGRAVTFLDLAGIEEDPSRRTERVALPDAFARLSRFGDKTVMLVNAGTGLALLDLHERTVASIAGPNLGQAVSDSDVGKLWLAPPGQDRVGYLDLASFHPAEVKLDATIESIIPVPSKSAPRVVVTHPSQTGYFTALDAKSPSVATAFSARGFFFEGVLDQGGGR